MRYIALDIEAKGLHPYKGTIWMLSITEGKKTRLYEDCNGMESISKEDRQMLEDEKVCKILHSSIYDAPYIKLNLGITIRNIWDTELCESVIVGAKPQVKRKKEQTPREQQLLERFSSALDYVLPRYGFKKPDKSIREEFIDRPKGKPFSAKAKQYAKDDTKDLPAIQKAQEYILKRDGLLEVALLENKVAERYHDMRVRGIGMDANIWLKIADEQLAEFNRRIGSLPKTVDNWNSPAQVKRFFQDRGVALETFDDLDKLYIQTKDKILGTFITTRELSKAVSSYGHDFVKFIDDDGRIRCGITQIINTGRNSMDNPNLQQLPGSGNNDPLRLKVLEMVTGDKKKKPQHRKAFVPRKGHVFVIGDFSGQEIGIMAAASGEDLWINALLRREDVHGLTASIISPDEWQHATKRGCTFPKKCQCPEHKNLREPAKISNFMQAYGGGAQRFAEYTGCSLVEASQFVAKHKRAIPNLTRYLNANGRESISTGVSYSADPYRRRRVLLGEEEWQVKNQGKNNPIQSAGANMLKLALVSLPWEFPVVLVIHDEIICEVPKAKANKCAKALKQIMEKSADYITGIKGLITVEPRIALNLMKE